MRPRTNSEKLLLGLLAAVVLLGGTFYGYKWIAQKQASLDLAVASMHADQTAAEVDLTESDLWTQRMSWVTSNQPPLDGSEDDAKSAVLTYVTKGARDHKLEIVEQNLNDASPTAAGTRVNVTVKVKGPMQDLVQWMTDLEKPSQFYAVTLFSLKADQDQKSMVCSVQVARYFKSGASQ